MKLELPHIAAYMQVNIPGILAEIPSHMLATLYSLQNNSKDDAVSWKPGPNKPAHFQPPSLEDLTELKVKAVTLDAHLLQCVELANIFCTTLHAGPEHSNPTIATYNWPAMQASALRIPPGVPMPSPVLAEYLKVLDVQLCKLLSVDRPALEAAFVATDHREVKW
jgi:hypothetical protein